ncbi:MAG: hypothetical protein LBT47_10900 [Deltaproteobacteria bacterium]|nr:hypothetical protein [Deltaproteobacteria bacterium]
MIYAIFCQKLTFPKVCALTNDKTKWVKIQIDIWLVDNVES